MTRKSKPHYDLNLITELLAAGHYYPTEKVTRTADALGFSETEMIDVFLNLERKDFDKSETSFNNNKEWQDYYHKRVKKTGKYINLFIKFLIRKRGKEIVVITSFKENEKDKY